MVMITAQTGGSSRSPLATLARRARGELGGYRRRASVARTPGSLGLVMLAEMADEDGDVRCRIMGPLSQGISTLGQAVEWGPAC